MMCGFCIPLSTDQEAAELPWFSELVASFGFDPTSELCNPLPPDPEPTHPLAGIPEVERVIAEERTMEFSRERITVRRPWVGIEALEATQAMPVIRKGEESGGSGG